MRKVTLILGIILALSILPYISVLNISAALPSLHAEEEPGWFLVWSDEFDYTGPPDATKWSFATDGNAWGWGNDEDQYYTADRLENAKVENGYLTITARKDDPVQLLHLLKDTSAHAHFITENELISNGGFDRNLSHWLLWADPSATVVDPLSVEDGALKVRIRRTGKYDWQIQFHQSIPLEEGKTYQLSFKVRSNRNRPIRVSFNQNHEPS